MKKTKRKSFQFQRSYFDVLNKLNKNSDKLNFLLAIINKSFIDEDPKNLSIMSDLAYESQRHFIEKSLKGWKSVKKTELNGSTLDGTPLGSPPGPLSDDPQTSISISISKSKSKSKSKSRNHKVTDEVTEKLNFSAEFFETYDTILKLFEKKFRPRTKAQIKSWYDCLDRLNRIEKLDFPLIIRIVQIARGHEIWSKHFHTFLKMRNKDNNGVMYALKWIDQFKKEKEKNGKMLDQKKSAAQIIQEKYKLS